MRRRTYSEYCAICGKDVFLDRNDYYMLKDPVWRTICERGGVDKSVLLCRSCAEELLGHRFTLSDYANVPLNEKFFEEEMKRQ